MVRAMTDPAPLAASAMVREFLAFLRRPAVLHPAGLRAPGAIASLGALIMLHLGVLMLVVLPVLYAWQTTFDLPAPDAFGKVDPALLPLIVVVIAPVAEEILFRGWQTGRPRALWLLLCAAALAALLMASALGVSPLAIGAGALVTLIAALAGWWLLRKRPAPASYTRAYPAIFWAAVLVFAGLHLMNYPSAALIGVPMVLPQLWGALVLGFVRMRIGLPASILAHAAANGAALGVATLAG